MPPHHTTGLISISSRATILFRNWIRCVNAKYADFYDFYPFGLPLATRQEEEEEEKKYSRSQSNPFEFVFAAPMKWCKEIVETQASTLL